MKKLHKRKGRNAAAAVLILLMLLQSFRMTEPVKAEMAWPAMVVCSVGGSVNVRQGPTTGSAILDTVGYGDMLTIIGKTYNPGNSSELWYQVRVEKGGRTIVGYMRPTYLRITRGDEEFVKQLMDAGFPESYAIPLSVLHLQYPAWRFEAVQTGQDWNHTLDMENRPGWSVVSKTSNDSQKSTESWAYDWLTNTWVGFDGTKWAAASRDYLAYRMDPRNYLDEVYIFMFEALSYQESQSIEGVEAILKNTFMDETRETGMIDFEESPGVTRRISYAEAFMRIGKEYGVSPYHLASRVRQEQGTGGTSALISGTYAGYEGYYNYFNVSAANNASGTATENGLAKAKREGWNTRYKSLCGGAKLLANSYIAKGQDTLYFEKFNVVNRSQLFAHQYMSAVDAPSSEAKSVSNGYTDKEQAFVFRIPVYTGMPAQAVTFTNTGNPNNYLKAINITNFTQLPGSQERPTLSITPSFHGATTSYSLVVPYEVNSVTIAAVQVASTSTVNGSGMKRLEVGSNEMQFVCTSQSGVSRTYKLSITREAQREAFSSQTYQIWSDKITGVSPNTGAADFLAGFEANEVVLKLLKADGSAQSGLVGTGNRLEVYKKAGNTTGERIASYQIVVFGDINGDGKISNADIGKLKRHILTLELLSGASLDAADTSKDGRISNADIGKLKRHILGLESI